MGCDTTASNTGSRNEAACILLEHKLEKELLWLAYRHHRLEIRLEAEILQELGTSSRPENAIFERFKNNLEKNYQNDFTTVSSDPLLS